MNRLPPIQFMSMFRRAAVQRGAMFGALLMLALLAFEVFNYSTTDFALTDLLGNDLRFLGLRWATILSIAFCAIDFAGVARLFTPEKGADEPVEVWYLFGAWVLAAAMNATLTWWGVAVAINGHTSLGSAIIERETLLKVVPIFVAVMVWTIRILLIGTFSMAGERLFSMASDRSARAPGHHLQNTAARPMAATGPNPAARPQVQAPAMRPTRPEPSYQPLGMVAKQREEDPSVRR